MSLAQIRAGVSHALGYLADSALTYRAGTSGSWLTFTGGVFNTDPAIGIGYDEDEGGEVQLETGLLVAQFTSPSLEIGYQIKDYHGQGWAIVGVDRSVSAMLYRCRRERLADDAYGPERGGRER